MRRAERRQAAAFALAIAAGLLAAAAAGAESLALPVPAERVLAPIREGCPDCTATGFLPCGSPDVQYGKVFARTAMQGKPARAYLLARTPTRSEALAILKGTGTEAVGAALVKAFASVRLVVLDDGWARVRVLEPSGDARAHVDAAQHACILDPARGLGCCLGDGPRDRGCLPKADPPTVRVDFGDPVSGEALELRYPIGAYEVKLSRRVAGRGETLYWCHGWKQATLR